MKKCCGKPGKDLVITLFLDLHLPFGPLLPSGGDQSLNPGRSTTIQTIATDEEEKIFSI
jgi:hypothetical protein